MNLGWSILLVGVTAGAAVAALLLVRRNAPDGSYFNDGDRAAGVGLRLSRELVCYGRSVVHEEWPRLEAGTEGDAINPWATALFETLRTTEPAGASEEAAYGKWLDQTSDRESARNSRIHGAEGVVPGPLWLVLFTIAAVIFVFMLFFAGSGERAVVQAVLIGTVITVIVATLLVVEFLDDPFDRGFGSLRPVAMERTLRILEEERLVVKETGPLPCDAAGRSLSA